LIEKWDIGGKAIGSEITGKTKDVRGWKILKWILARYNGMVWIGLDRSD
jgi:hypothetical protein